MPPIIYHLVPKTAATPNHTTAYLASLVGLGAGNHKLVPVAGRALAARRLEADIIVSHMPIRWKTFPFLVALRAANPDKQILHVQKRPAQSQFGPAVSARIPQPLRHSALALFDKVVWTTETA